MSNDDPKLILRSTDKKKFDLSKKVFLKCQKKAPISEEKTVNFF